MKYQWYTTSVRKPRWVLLGASTARTTTLTYAGTWENRRESRNRCTTYVAVPAASITTSLVACPSQLTAIPNSKASMLRIPPATAKLRSTQKAKSKRTAEERNSSSTGYGLPEGDDHAAEAYSSSLQRKKTLFGFCLVGAGLERARSPRLPCQNTAKWKGTFKPLRHFCGYVEELC